MSVQSEIDRIARNLANTYSVLEGAGAEMPQTRNSNNLPNTAASIKAVLYAEQNLTEAQKAQARDNIGAAAIGEGGGSSSAMDSFINNTDIDYCYDESTGAYYNVIRVYRNKLDGTKQYPFVYAPNGAEGGSYSTHDMVVNDGWLLAINSGVFDTSTEKPDGILIQNGVAIQNTPSATHNQCKPLTIDSDGNLSYASYDVDANTLISNGIVSAVCGFMPIIVNFEAVPDSEWNSVGHYTENAQRQIIGQFGNGDYAIITCEGRGYQNSDGWTILEAQSICKRLGLKFAYNLDGGGSTETMLGLKHINTIYEGTTGRIVPTFIVFNGRSVFATADGVPIYGVTNNLNGVTTSNPVSSAVENSVYTAKLLAESDGELSVNITMGGVDITATAYDGNGNINIAKVTGVISITAYVKPAVTLPSGYTLKSYVEANGNQYAVSPILIADIATCGIEYKVSVNKNNGVDGSGHVLSGASWYTPFLRFYQSTGRQLMVNKKGKETTVDYPIIEEAEYTIKAFMDGDNSIYVNDELITEAPFGNTNLSTTAYLNLFAYDTTTKRFRFSGKFYYMAIYSATGEILYKFVPCTSNEGVAGLYEVVNGRFFRSESGTDFITHD